MIDVGAKADTQREAVAEGVITMLPATAALVRDSTLPKGNALETARVAAIMAAKRTPDIIPLCHPLLINHASCEFQCDAAAGRIHVTTRVRCTGKTGVEMEALTRGVGRAADHLRHDQGRGRHARNQRYSPPRKTRRQKRRFCAMIRTVMQNDFLQEQSEDEGWLKLGVAAELARKYGQDQRDFLHMLAALLENVLPEATELEQQGGWFAKKTLHRIIVTLGEFRYTLEDPGHGSLLAARTRIVRGIALKTEEIPVHDWIAELGAALDERAKTSQAAREALSKLVG